MDVSPTAQRCLILEDWSCAAPKGTMSRDLRPSFFHDSYPHGPLMHMLKYICIWYQFHGRYSHVQKTQGVTTAMGVRLCNVNDSAESKNNYVVFSKFFFLQFRELFTQFSILFLD